MIILNGSIGNYIRLNNVKYSYFAGNNYLGLASHPDVIKASVKSIKKFGVNFSASRCTTGTAGIHIELEKELSIFKGKQDTVVYASGFQGNSILLELLKSRYSAVFIDEFAHPSITGSIPREIVNVYYYSHCDINSLEQLLSHHNGLSPLIITDGVFALTGEIAPLDKIYLLVNKYNAILVVDDAHSTGVLGKTGKGTPEHFNLVDASRIFQTETMSKALGGYGGFISGNLELTDLIRNKSSIYQSTTALPPPIVAAGIASMKVLRENPELHIGLLKRAAEIRKEIIRMGFSTSTDNTPIIPIMLSELSKAKDLSLFLENNKIIVPFVNYPVKLAKYIVRITISACHTNEQSELLLHMLKKWKDINGTE